ncbi:nickel transport complex, NikM subunit,transmembrane [Jiulongibacter sp. NS-SX5]|uniref:nickel transport complex, NikM subunit,transmembrane n=1 Tax=Jiulongibacter sp. NS-SX5 TaxID=3463854 RepID=UPI00405857E7
MKNWIITCFSVLLPLLGSAHGYWLEVPAKANLNGEVTVKLYYGEYASQIREVGDRLDKMELIEVSVITPEGFKIPLEMNQTHTHWEAKYTPTGNGEYQVIGINDTREVQDWHKHNLGITRPIQYLRTSFIVGNGTVTELTSNNTQYLDIKIQQNENNVEIWAFKNGEALAKSKVRVVNPEGWLQDKWSNKAGFVSVVPNEDGLYLVEIEWIDKTPGSFKDKAYESIRHKCDVTFIAHDMSLKL